ncbi:MAG: flagellar export chaperone FliS [Spirochaetales bacterium]|nr:flagellar export chaperone FliS [Spirochaetales bacterium]
MNPYTNPLKAYKETNIRTASQGKLIVMLYDEAIRQLTLAIQELGKQSRKLDIVHNAVVKAQDVITELTASLDFEKGGEIAKNLLGLYLFFNRQLMEANVRKDAKPMEDVRKLLGELREAWIQIAHVQVEEPTPRSGVNLAG